MLVGSRRRGLRPAPRRLFWAACAVVALHVAALSMWGRAGNGGWTSIVPLALSVRLIEWHEEHQPDSRSAAQSAAPSTLPAEPGSANAADKAKAAAPRDAVAALPSTSIEARRASTAAAPGAPRLGRFTIRLPAADISGSPARAVITVSVDENGRIVQMHDAAPPLNSKQEDAVKAAFAETRPRLEGISVPEGGSIRATFEVSFDAIEQATH